MHFGIREHAMGAIVNGLSLSKVRPYGSGVPRSSATTAARAHPPRRASWRSRSIYVFTHDSIGVGEDGPTHQPIEQLASLRAIPGLITLRPGDANEVVEAWRVIMQLRHEPVGAGADAAGAAHARPHEVRAGGGPARRAPTCWPTRRAASPR